jgi:CheY-like chemotaxis protein
MLIDKVLKKWGLTADFAVNGKQAVDKIELNRNYDLVLMDIHMPEMDGLEAARYIRQLKDPYFQQLHIIALTASMLTNQMDLIDEAGMNDYILKPFDPKNLYDKISKFSKE